MRLTTGRTENGSGIVEGTVGMMMVLSLMVIAVLFIYNVSILGNYQNKLDFINMQAAQWAANNNNHHNNGTEPSFAFVQAAMGYAGLTVNDLKVTTTSKGQGVIVRVSNSFSLFGKASWLPEQVTLSSSQIVPGFVSYLRFPGIGGSCYDCYVPVVSMNATNSNIFYQDLCSLIGNEMSTNSTTLNNFLFNYICIRL